MYQHFTIIKLYDKFVLFDTFKKNHLNYRSHTQIVYPKIELNFLPYYQIKMLKLKNQSITP